MAASPPQGILVCDKPQGITSHGVVSRLRRWFGTKKVGHAGTLDPMATGVLVLGLGRGTKLLTYLTGASKTYAATIRLGAGTPTDDADSDPDVFAASGAVQTVSDEAIRAGAQRLTGEISQVPSSVSAIKVDGVRSYARVRSGEDVRLKARPVTVSRFAVGGIRRVDAFGGAPALIDVDVEVDCSSGTYIRALARDLGTDLGVHGHLIALRRTRVGPFGLDEAHGIPADLDAPPPEPLSLAAVASALLPSLEVDVAAAKALMQGRTITVPAAADAAGEREIAVHSGGRLVSIAAVAPDGRCRSLTAFAIDLA